MFNDFHPAGSIVRHASQLQSVEMAPWLLAFANLVSDEVIHTLAQ
jgi:hypothetical protein